MRQFYLPPQVHKFDTFAEFVKEFNVGEGDLLFTNEFLYEPYMKALELKCDVYFQEKYGLTEPTDIMYNSILADIPEGKYKRIVAVGGGSVVVKDIPDNVVAVGNPCRPIRPITESDKHKSWDR